MLLIAIVVYNGTRLQKNCN